MKDSLGLMGKKIGMTQIFTDEGAAIPITVVQLGDNIVTDKMTKERNGYSAVQIGGWVVKEKKLNKPELGKLKKHNLPVLRPLKEFRISDVAALNIGDSVKAEELLKEGMLVDIQGKSIGKGFQGTIKRYHAGRGPMSHGSKFHRSMGSIGPGTTPGRVFKGLHMPGQMGNVVCTARHITVVKVDPEKKLLLVKGSTPGADGSTLVITPSKTKWNG